MQYKNYLHKHSHKNYAKIDTEGCAKFIYDYLPDCM